MKQLGFLDRYLTVWIFSAMLVGGLLGFLIPTWPSMLNSVQVGTTNIPLAIGLILMMYPPLAKVDYSLLGEIFKDLRLLVLSLVQNWLVGPVLMFGLAALTLADRPGYFAGLMLIGVARCIAMVIVWSDLAGGNRQYTAALVAMNSLFQVLFYSVYAVFFVSVLPSWFGLNSYQIDISMAEVAISSGIYLGIPFLMAVLSRKLIIATKGRDWLDREYLPRIGPITLISLLFTVILMFSLKGALLLAVPFEVLRIAIPLTLYFVLMFGLAWALAKRAGADTGQRTSLAFTAAGNNFELGIAVAISVFGLDSDQALATVVGPLIEVPVLLLLVRAVSRR